MTRPLPDRCLSSKVVSGPFSQRMMTSILGWEHLFRGIFYQISTPQDSSMLIWTKRTLEMFCLNWTWVARILKILWLNPYLISQTKSIMRLGKTSVREWDNFERKILKSPYTLLVRWEQLLVNRKLIYRKRNCSARLNTQRKSSK